MKQLIILFLLCFATPAWSHHVVGFLIPVSGLGDQSFNDMTYAGLIRAKNSHDFQLVRHVCKGNSQEDLQQGMQALIDQGATIVVSNGWEMRSVVELFAKNYPDRYFILNDYPLPGLPNVISTVFAQHEGSFLAGFLAAQVSTTKKLGFIGGKDMPVIRAFFKGYEEGSRLAQPQIGIVARFLSGPNEQTSGFDNPQLAYTEASALYNQGVDIIFSVAGLAGNGVIQAAVEQDRLVIGVDADQDHLAKGHVLTSVMKRLDIATADIVARTLAGNTPSGVFYFNLKNGGVSLSPMTYTRDQIPPPMLQELEKVKQQIIQGELNVTNVLSEGPQGGGQ